MGKHGAFTGNRLIWLKHRHKHIVKELEMNAKSGWHKAFLVMQRGPSSRHYDLLRGPKRKAFHSRSRQRGIALGWREGKRADP